MNYYTIFYLMSIADGLSTFAVWIAVLSTIVLGISLLIRIPHKIFNEGTTGLIEDNERDDDDERKEKEVYRTALSRIIKHTAFYAILFWTLYIAIPERRDMILIVAGGTIGEFIANDENAQKLPSEVFQFLRKEVLEATADLDETVANEVKKELGIKSVKDKLMKKSKEELIEMLETNDNNNN